ncbi:ATP12 family chaperone protein [Methylovirgula sp. HY1]|uniref:ATP12 family chaperone protein n=1 Tax=Methylovirgula sp. HY1 TaxID=2822761 RepID=UPI001C5B18C2|nr:ATP12 family protein [Methylovirgula sp. HY1]
MSDEVTKPSAEAGAPSGDPVALGRQSQKTPLRKRFYTTAGVMPHEGGFAVMLDGRPVLTPAKTRLSLPTLVAAEALAGEWLAQGDEINPAEMPLTRIVNSAIDGVAQAMEAVTEDIVKYAGTDLVCYRAEGPDSLVKAQAEAWNPVLAFAEADMGARFFCVEGLIHVAQPESSLAAVRAKVDRMVGTDATAPIALASLSVMTGLTGSLLIVLARVSGAMSLAQAWAAAHVDEDFQIKLWGADQEAMDRRGRRFAEMAAADRLWQLVRS